MFYYSLLYLHIKKWKKVTVFLYAAAKTTLIAGILHLIKVTDTINGGDKISNAYFLYLVGGEVTQVF